MRFVSTLADKMLAKVAPKAKAGACIPDDPFTKYCYCSGGLVYVKNCHNNCLGTVYCGTCYNSWITC